MARRNSDERFRDLIRRINAGEHDLIPVLAREWERQGGRSVVPPNALTEVAAAFARLERSPATDDPRVLLAADVVAGDRDAGFLFGVMTALGLTADELWEESERVRSGVGNARLQRMARRARRNDMESWGDAAVARIMRVGLTQLEANTAVGYMIESPEEATEATNSRSLALAALRWHMAVWDGKVWDAEHDADSDHDLEETRKVRARAALALAAFEASQ